MIAEAAYGMNPLVLILVVLAIVALLVFLVRR
jgi:hypothetical protein